MLLIAPPSSSNTVCPGSTPGGPSAVSAVRVSFFSGRPLLPHRGAGLLSPSSACSSCLTLKSPLSCRPSCRGCPAIQMLGTRWGPGSEGTAWGRGCSSGRPGSIGGWRLSQCSTLSTAGGSRGTPQWFVNLFGRRCPPWWSPLFVGCSRFPRSLFTPIPIISLVAASSAAALPSSTFYGACVAQGALGKRLMRDHDLCSQVIPGSPAKALAV